MGEYETPSRGHLQSQRCETPALSREFTGTGVEDFCMPHVKLRGKYMGFLFFVCLFVVCVFFFFGGGWGILNFLNCEWTYFQ